MPGRRIQRETTLSRLKPGSEVNMEADLVARYVEGFAKARHDR